MIFLIAATTALLTSSTPEIVHLEKVERAGAAYDVQYTPQLLASQKTIGAAAGTRFSQQKCRWQVTVKAKREIMNPSSGASLTKILPEKRSFGGEVFGDCRQNSAAIQTAQNARMKDVHQIVQEFAQADRPHVGMDIDAAHALASN